MLTRRGLLRRPVIPELKQDHCTICLDTFNSETIHGLLPCNHSNFCLQCILGWAEVANKCPICVARFFSVTPCLPNGQLVPNTTPFDVEHRDQEEDFDYSDSEDEEVCKVCENYVSSEHLLICQDCGDSYHLNCLSMLEVPNVETWYCDECLQRLPKKLQKEQWKEMIAVGRPKKQKLEKRRSERIRMLREKTASRSVDD
ncbi:unnamed protein product [Blepharisma stoltei]|uniref:PHD and RING finger domain-containing protein 1 n=1 Tax=Blepharisma stoltei TaxID=1481888 RepID=A0AAU9KAW5_9CILI|nr:unnamed protein product [Blepharisma stoltei]